MRLDMYFDGNNSALLGSSLSPEQFDMVNLYLPVHGSVIDGHVEINLDHDFIKTNFLIPKQGTFWQRGEQCSFEWGVYAIQLER